MAERTQTQRRSLLNVMELIRPELMPPEAIRQMAQAMAENDTTAGAQAMGQIFDSLLPAVVREVDSAMGEPAAPMPPEAMEFMRKLAQTMTVHFMTVAGKLADEHAIPLEAGQLAATEPADGQ